MIRGAHVQIVSEPRVSTLEWKCTCTIPDLECSHRENTFAYSNTQGIFVDIFLAKSSSCMSTKYNDKTYFINHSPIGDFVKNNPCKGKIVSPSLF